MTERSKYLNVGVLLFIILLGYVLYAPSLHSKSFIFDDEYSVQNDQAIRTLDVPKIFEAFNTRFLVGLSFALNYKYCGLDPSGFRVVNFLIHCLNAFLVFLLVRSTLNLCPAYKRSSSGSLEWPAFFSSILFLCHPLQTEPVNYITQRFVLMGAFFYLLTLYLYVRYRARLQIKYLIASQAAAIAAMFCKEFTVTLPLMLVMYEFYFLDPAQKITQGPIKRLIPFFIIALIVPIMLLRTPLQTIGVAKIARTEPVVTEGPLKAQYYVDITRACDDIGRKQYFLTQLNVVCTYIRLMFVPVHQNLDYDYPITDHLDGKTFFCGAFLLFLLSLSVVMFSPCRILSFAVLWFFLVLSLESSIIPIGHVIAEYRMYLATLGFALLVMDLLYMRQMDLKVLNVIALAIIIAFSVVTYQRNKIWTSELTIWNDVIQKSPHKARPYYNRGLAYYRLGDYTRSSLDYQRTVELDPKYVEAYINKGINDDQEGKFDQSLADYNKAIEIDPDISEAYYNRGYAYMKRNNFTQALIDYNKAIELRPNYIEAYINMGSIYFNHGDLGRALSLYSKAIDIDPGSAAGYFDRAVTYYQLRNYSNALNDLQQAKKLGYPVIVQMLEVYSQHADQKVIDNFK